MLKDKRKLTIIVLSVWISFVFVQSLFFKFSGAPETQHIFGTLDAWAADKFGIEGLFLPPGIFNAYVIGSAELVASALLLARLFTGKEIFTLLGSVLGIGIMSGAISFHLFTPLGVDVQGDGGTLFAMACTVWVSSAILIYMHKNVACTLLCKKK